MTRHDLAPVGTRYESRVEIPCATCRTRGRLWLGGGDYLECPHCEGRGHYDLVEARIEPAKIFAARRV